MIASVSSGVGLGLLLLLGISSVDNVQGFVLPVSQHATRTGTILPLPSCYAESRALFASKGEESNEEEEEEWHPRDPAHTTPQLLAGLWHQIAQAGSMTKGVRLDH